ncbi:uncharacterized protein LOC134248953, partial [Saccostrea cucullata]|uniref:uncharacterized protein LOC134248953 n=1 Tax=Saccostrea cuccullata TaxID=36930 RepID=UPI002ED32406
MNLGVEATLSDILARLDSVYGLVDRVEAVLADFYSARQKPDEDVTSWSCRLEDIMCKVRQTKDIDSSERNSMLHNMLWIGLNSSLKDITGYLFNSIQSFDELRTALRRVEQEHLVRSDIHKEDRNSMESNEKQNSHKKQKFVKKKDTSNKVSSITMQVSSEPNIDNSSVNRQDHEQMNTGTVSSTSYVPYDTAGQKYSTANEP